MNDVLNNTITKKKPLGKFANKIPIILSLILDSVEQDIIQKVYLFGSYVYGNPKENSDIDICVIIDDKANRPEI